MKTYHGDRTQQGCVVTVDGKPLLPRSDLSGNATTAFDWGYAGGGQLSGPGGPALSAGRNLGGVWRKQVKRWRRSCLG